MHRLDIRLHKRNDCEPYAAQRLLKEYEKELEVTVVPVREMGYGEQQAQVIPEDDGPPATDPRDDRRVVELVWVAQQIGYRARPLLAVAEAERKDGRVYFAQRARSVA